MRVTGNVQCGGSGVSRYRTSCTVAPCVGEEGVAAAGGGRAGINAGGQDIGKSVDLSLRNLVVGESCGDAGKDSSVGHASRSLRSLGTGNVGRVGSTSSHRVSRRHSRYFVNEDERRGGGEGSAFRARTESSNQANSRVGTVATAVSAQHIEIDLAPGGTSVVGSDGESA